MSLMKTLAKVAIGVAVAKGASSMMKGGGGGAGGGLGGLLQGMSGAAGGAGAGGMGNMMGSLLGGGAQGGGLASGGLGGILEQLGGAQGGGGLQSMLGGLAGGGGAGGLLAGLAGGGAAGGLLGGLTQAMGGGAAQPSGNSFGAVLNSQFDETPEPALTPDPDQEAMAALMLRAMIQATKADGELDESEKAKLIDQLGGDVDAEEAQFVQAEMQRPLDIDGLINDTPAQLAPQIYAMSLLGIDLDSQAEAQYLHKLAQGFGMDSNAVNNIHEQLGVPSLYS